MATERLSISTERLAERDLLDLAAELDPYGGSLAFVDWVRVPDSMVVAVRFPEDEEKAQRCREILALWTGEEPERLDEG